MAEGRECSLQSQAAVGLFTELMAPVTTPPSAYLPTGLPTARALSPGAAFPAAPVSRVLPSGGAADTFSVSPAAFLAALHVAVVTLTQPGNRDPEL